MRPEIRRWVVRRLVTAALACRGGGDQEDAVRALVLEEGMEEDSAREFVRQFWEHIEDDAP